MVEWSTYKPRTAISSSRSRTVRQYRRYHLTQCPITWSSKWRRRKSVVWVFGIGPHAIKSRSMAIATDSDCRMAVWAQRTALPDRTGEGTVTLRKGACARSGQRLRWRCRRLRSWLNCSSKILGERAAAMSLAASQNYHTLNATLEGPSARHAKQAAD